ncbi:MAG: lipopolysaccharide kinase InaA family protein [Lachnospiraceae bacterium]|nr:lipopolysaccharide kinase InaA family protein [Lachnospiraceae bacterium]
MQKYNIYIGSRYEHLRKEIVDIAKNGIPSSAEKIYEGRNALYRLTLGNTVAIIKAFKLPGFINSRIYTTLRKSKAYRSYHNSKKMISLGFHVPEPIAYIEVTRGMRLMESYYICEEIKGRELRHWEDYPESVPMLPALAAEILKLHRAGVYHKDFSPGNILYTGNESTGYKFYFVDLNRMEFGVKSRKKLMSMFKSINLNTPEMLKLARLYAKAAGEDEETVAAEALAANKKYMAKRNFKKKLKKYRKS